MGRGASTAVSTNLSYRLGKLQQRGVLRGRWLDCGCADGGYTRGLAARGANEVVGVDIEAVRLKQALAKETAGATIEYCQSVSEALPFQEASFDGILLNEVLEHVSDEQATLRELYRVLRPGGHLIIMSPNRWFPFEGHGMQIGGWHVAAPIPLLPWLPSRLTIPFLRARNYWPHELRGLAQQAGFEVLESSSVLPVLQIYPWLPQILIRWYRRAIPLIERVPLLRRLGVSTFIVARRPIALSQATAG